MPAHAHDAVSKQGNIYYDHKDQKCFGKLNSKSWRSHYYTRRVMHMVFAKSALQDLTVLANLGTHQTHPTAVIIFQRSKFIVYTAGKIHDAVDSPTVFVMNWHVLFGVKFSFHKAFRAEGCDWVVTVMQVTYGSYCCLAEVCSMFAVG